MNFCHSFHEFRGTPVFAVTVTDKIGNRVIMYNSLKNRNLYYANGKRNISNYI